MDIDAVNVVETANIPDQQSSPSISKNGIIGVLLGVLLSVAIILIAYISNDTVKTQEDVEKYLGLSVLGTIPLTETDRKRKRKNRKKPEEKIIMKEVNIYRQELDYSANESYKSLRTNLLFCGEDKKVIAVTSCTPNEGKSTVSLNLALSLADSGKKFFY